MNMDISLIQTTPPVSCAHCQCKAKDKNNGNEQRKLSGALKHKVKNTCDIQQTQYYISGSAQYRINVTNSIGKEMISLYILVLTFLLVAKGTSSASTYYPPFFNVALNKDLSILPEESVCGINGENTYCESRQLQQNLCDELTCNVACEDTTSIGVFTDLFSAVEDEQPWQCAFESTTFYSPNASSTNSFHFNSSSSPCYLTLRERDMFQLILSASWSQTITFWVWHDLAVNRKGTIVDFRDQNSIIVIKIRMDGAYVGVVMGNDVVSNQAWEVPRNEWTHVAIQIFEDRTSVLFNGILKSPSMYNTPRNIPPNNAGSYYLGDTRPGGENFVGYLQDLRLYYKSLSNREVLEVMTGTLPTVRLQNECRCPPGFPQILTDDSSRCVQNDGQGSTAEESYRVTRESYLPGFINDGVIDSKWISQPPYDNNAAIQENQITIYLHQVYEVRDVEVTFYSPYPNVVIIQRQRNHSANFEDWQLYSDDCNRFLSYTPNEALARADSVSCKSLVDAGEITPYSGGQKKFSLLYGRPGQTGDQFSTLLREFLQAYAVRIILRGHDTVSFEKHKYHSLYEVTVNATCDCHGHGVACDTSVNPYVCTCSPESLTEGTQCDQCSQNTYRLPEKDVYDPDLCLPCDCFTNGTIGGSMQCDSASGQCPCKDNVEGRRCDQCKPSYYLLEASNQDGCTYCACDLRGVYNATAVCDNLSGDCLCKENVIGDQCSSCALYHYGLSEENPDGCSSCNCNEAGVIAGNISCDISTGECDCKTFAAGRTCSTCQNGYYNLEIGNPDGCIECHCSTNGSYNNSCDLTTGQCHCKPNVAGRSCDRCAAGFFALDEADFISNGCLYSCNCSDIGTVDDAVSSCMELGGQCRCKANTEGRTCDQCKLLSYGFGTSNTYGCTACDCDNRGTVDIGMTCDQQTGQCGCKQFTTSQRCDHCVPGYFSLQSDNIDGCSTCDCHPLGTNVTAACDEVTGQCVCISGHGEPERAGRQCSPYITSVVPVFGPESGGTEVTVAGGYFGNVTQASVYFGQISCPLLETESSPTSLKCVTPGLDNSTEFVKNIGQAIVIELLDNNFLNSSQVYIYKEDPVIRTVNPLKSILSGGILLTVTGTHLDSVAFPYLEITMVYTHENGSTSTYLFDSLCTGVSDTTMTCPTPELDLPEDFSISQRKKRQVTGNNLQYQLNSDSLQFYIGFRLDGVMIYKNMTDSDAQYSVLQVYINPEFESFEEELKVFRPYWPFSETHVSVKGERLNLGATANDYVIAIGEDFCEGIDVSDNAILCVPPSRQPSAAETGEKDGAPAFVIRVGNIVHKAGYLKYEKTLFDNSTYRWAVIGAIIGFVVLVILIIIVCVIVCKKRNRDESEKKLSHLDQFDHFDTHLVDDNLNNKSPASTLMLNNLDNRANGRLNDYTPDGQENRNISTLPPLPRNGEHKRHKEEDFSSFMPTTLPSPSSKSDGYSYPYERRDVSSTSSYLTAMTTAPDIMSILPPDLKYRVEQRLLDFSKLTISVTKHQGKIGKVYNGMYSDKYYSRQIPVLIKTITERTPRETQNFLEDSVMMREFESPNVLPLIGISINGNHVYSVTPMVENGNLKSFISSEENMLTVGELLNFGFQVAKGMNFLANNRIIHKDLAARNCVVDKDLVVKITDRAIASDRFPQEYWKRPGRGRPVPIRWMAPETLEIDVFTIKSDVWSVGVLLWELLTRGIMPYPDVPSHSITNFLLCGNRLDKPDFSPAEVYTLMLECWDESPRQRPHFPEVCERLSTFLYSQNSQTNLKNRSRQVPSSRKKGLHYTHLYS